MAQSINNEISALLTNNTTVSRAKGKESSPWYQWYFNRIPNIDEAAHSSLATTLVKIAFFQTPFSHPSASTFARNIAKNVGVAINYVFNDHVGGTEVVYDIGAPLGAFAKVGAQYVYVFHNPIYKLVENSGIDFEQKIRASNYVAEFIPRLFNLCSVDKQTEQRSSMQEHPTVWHKLHNMGQELVEYSGYCYHHVRFLDVLTAAAQSFTKTMASDLVGTAWKNSMGGKYFHEADKYVSAKFATNIAGTILSGDLKAADGLDQTRKLVAITFGKFALEFLLTEILTPPVRIAQDVTKDFMRGPAKSMHLAIDHVADVLHETVKCVTEPYACGQDMLKMLDVFGIYGTTSADVADKRPNPHSVSIDLVMSDDFANKPSALTVSTSETHTINQATAEQAEPEIYTNEAGVSEVDQAPEQATHNIMASDEL